MVKENNLQKKNTFTEKKRFTEKKLGKKWGWGEREESPGCPWRNILPSEVFFVMQQMIHLKTVSHINTTGFHQDLSEVPMAFDAYTALTTDRSMLRCGQEFCAWLAVELCAGALLGLQMKTSAAAAR